MKIIYIYHKNFYAAIKAAYMHLKLQIPENLKDIKDKYSREGHFYYLGIDGELNEIYLLYSKKNSYMLRNLLNSFASLYSDEVIIIDLDNKYKKERW